MKWSQAILSVFSLSLVSSVAFATDGTGRSYDCLVKQMVDSQVVATETVTIANMYLQFSVGSVKGAGWVNDLGVAVIHLGLPMGEFSPEAYASTTVDSARFTARLTNANRTLASAECTLNP